MYNNYKPFYQVAPYIGLKGRPVSSIEEARGSIIDFDGSIFFFPDLANNRIYTKQIGVDGTAILNMYELKEFSDTSAQYVTKEEFQAVIQQLRQQAIAPSSVPMEHVSRSPEAPLALNF